MNIQPSTSRFSLMQPEIWAGKMYLGSWSDGEGGALDVTDKATGETIASVANANPADIERACLVAQNASAQWAATTPSERARIVRRAGDLLMQNKEDAIYWLVRESGSTRFKAEFEVTKTIEHFYHAADAVTVPWRTVVADTQEMLSYYERTPLGVVAVIGPFNFPLILALRAVAPAIACGNSVVLKPSSNTTVSGGILLARLFEEAGLPAGVLSVIPGNGGAGNALVNDPNVAMIAFTGSTPVGREIGASAGRALKRVALELGGKNPFIVLQDADIELAARAAAFGTFLHQGQICIAIGLHIVHESLVEAYGSRLAELAREMQVGDPWQSHVALGPLISERQRDLVHSLVEDAVRQGATLREGGTYEGQFYRPTVLTNISDSARLFREEAFGPVAAIVSFRDEDEAIRIANGSGYGLSAGIFGEIAHARAVGARLESGMVHVNNQPVLEDARAPFGGVKASGNMTRIGGSHDLDDYTTFRWVTETKEPTLYSLPNT